MYMADSVAAITGLDPAQAASYLEMAGGDVVVEMISLGAVLAIYW